MAPSRCSTKNRWRQYWNYGRYVALIFERRHL